MTAVRTHYDNLQVARNASAEVIRGAYLGLSQKWHPDRYPPEQRARYEQVMKILDAAYETLSDPRRRLAYDRWLANRVDTAAATSRIPPELLLPRKAPWKAVPPALRKELVLMKSRREGYAMALSAQSRASLKGYLPVLIIIGAVCGCATSEAWQSPKPYVYSWVVLMAVSIYSVHLGWRLLKLWRSPCGFGLGVTPTHLLEMTRRGLTAWPLLGTEKYSTVAHSGADNGYQHSTVEFVHTCGTTKTFKLVQRPQSSRLQETLLENHQQLRQLPAARLLEKFGATAVSALGPAVDLADPPDILPRVASLVAGILLATLMLLTMVRSLNDAAPVMHGPPPVSFSREPAATEILPIKPPFLQPEQPMPPTGWLRRPRAPLLAPLTVTSPPGSSYLLKLVDKKGIVAGTLFVRGAAKLVVDVPLGSYTMRYAYGETWYGPTYLFGPDTSYSELNASFDFQADGDRYAGYEMTLIKQSNGNLTEHAIPADVF